MASSIFFAGRQWISPATMSLINDAAMAPVSATVGNILAIIGNSDGGAPNTILRFASPADAAGQLLSGDLLTAVTKAFAPSTQTGGPSSVVGIRIGTSTPSALNLLDASAANVINLVSTAYGISANLTKIQITAGTSVGKKVTVQNGTSYQTQDNLGRAALTMQYAGAAASATITITSTSVVLAAPIGTTVATIDLTVYTTAGKLADRISATPGFTATVFSSAINTPALNGLDAVSAVDVRTAPYVVRADLQAIVDWLNSNSQSFVVATRVAGAGTLPANVAWTFLSGATAPAPTISDWTNALVVLQTEDVQWVVPLAGDPAVHAATDAHVQFMSTVGRRERRALVGPPAGTAIAALPALALAINSDRTEMVYPGYYDYDVNGNYTLFAPYFSASLTAAGFAGINPGETMTNKTLAVRGLEVILRNPVDTDLLITAGIAPLEKSLGGFKMTRAVSTWLANNNFNRVEVSVGAATDYVARTVRIALDILRGQPANPRTLARATQIADSTLAFLARPAPGGIGVIVGDANSPAYKNITATLTGDAIAVSFQCSPVIPANFIPVTISIVPYSGTASI